MIDIVKGVIGGAWTLLVGWIFPTAINVVLLLFAISAVRKHVHWINQIWPDSPAGLSLLAVATAVLFGLILSALQNPLYRILEGYLLWPTRAYTAGCARQRNAKQLYIDRLKLIRLEGQAIGDLSVSDIILLGNLRKDPRLAHFAAKDKKRTPPQVSVLRERKARYPHDNEQITPTRLGNAIRRLEEYGYDRYRLDTQILWNELTGTVPEQVRRQVEFARASVDFFVCLLYGHVVVLISMIALVAAHTHGAGVFDQLVIGISVLVLIPVWYRAAVSSTDEWAAAVRALVNIGRKPLADALELQLPPTLTTERVMWDSVCRFSRISYTEQRATLLYPFRKRR